MGFAALFYSDYFGRWKNLPKHLNRRNKGVYKKEALVMNGKVVVSVLIVVIVAVSAYYVLIAQQSRTTINPIDLNNEYKDYQVLESTGAVAYRVIGQIEEISEEELMLRTNERILKIKKPEETKYVALVPPVLIAENQLRQGELVRVTVNVSKSTNEIVALTVTVFGIYNKNGELIRISPTSS